MRYLILAVSALMVAACSSSAKDGAVTLPIPVAVDAPEALASVPESALGPQDLLPGECGLFLWSKTDVTKFIFFSKAIRGTALISRAEGPVAITQTGASGNIFGQFTTQMTYADGAGVLIALRLEPGAELEGGQRIESGMITTTDAQGWLTKLPVLGVQACQPE